MLALKRTYLYALMKSHLLESAEKFYTLFLVLLFIFSTTALTGVIAEEYKIGVVDALKVLEQAPQAERMALELRKEFEDRNKDIIQLREQLTDLSERLTKDAAIINEMERTKLEREIYMMSRELQRTENEYKEDFSFRRNEILIDLQQEIVEAIQVVSKKYEFDIVLSEGVNWASPRVNMTPLVIEYLKNNNK